MDDNNWHTCLVCSSPVHDYGPEADAENIDGLWLHATCREPEVVGDILTKQLQKSVALSCKHPNATNINAGRMWDTNEFFRTYFCPDCKQTSIKYGEPE